MRTRRWLVVLALTALAGGVLASPAAGTWGDSSEANGAPLELLTLTAPTLACAESTGPLLSNAATISWTPSTVPTTLSYSAVVIDGGIPLSVVINSSTQLYPSLLSTLFGSTVTVRVTATLPGTSWTATSERTVVVGLAGLYVNCS